MEFESLMHIIEAHPRYGPDMRAAVAEGVPLVLNYHSHNGSSWCVSICAKHTNAYELLTKGLEDLRELVHIEGFGSSKENGRKLCEALSITLLAHYELERLPELYLESKPMPR